MVPLDLRVKRTKKLMARAPEGQAWCAGCQSWRDLEDFGKNATQCRPCAWSVTHETMVAKTYGLGPGQYDALVELQGGRCAICRNRPKSKSLAVDHDHKTGVVRGLLCSRCNHDLMGAAWDSAAMALALWHYMNTPPAAGSWIAPELGLTRPDEGGAVRPSKASADELGLVVTHGKSARETKQSAPVSRSYVLPPDWASKEPAELHQLWAQLDRLLRSKDPAPF